MASTTKASSAAKPAAPAEHAASAADSTSPSAIAYGDPIEMGGTTIVPVTLASYGVLASKGDETSTDPGASSAGFAVPMGAYVTRDGYTRFEPNLISLLAVGIPFVWVAGRALARIIRALKK